MSNEGNRKKQQPQNLLGGILKSLLSDNFLTENSLSFLQ